MSPTEPPQTAHRFALPIVLVIANAAWSAGAAAASSATVATTCSTAEHCYELAKGAPSSAARRQLFQSGIRVAEARLAANADDPPGLFWLAVNLGAEAAERGKVQALGAVARMEKLLLRCAEVAPRYEHGGAARVLGRLYHKAPGVISIGSSKKARAWLERALAIDSGHPGNLAFAADFFAAQGETARAQEMARQCLRGLSSGGFGPDADSWRKLARDVLGGAAA